MAGIWPSGRRLALFEEFDRSSVPTSCTINALTALNAGRLSRQHTKKAGKSAHNWSQTDMSSYSGKPGEERDVIVNIDAAGVVGKPPRGWLSSSLPRMKRHTC